ncbi:MAG TPA: endolytic transglycosylase MltG [Halanaerobiales bacterium]|nr:endolytic transglycosylase MltG [Halanaerobiales bacterium]
MKKSAIILFILIILITFSVRFITFLQPVERNTDDVYSVNIDYGSTSKKVANVLEDNNIIRSSFAFNVVINILGYDNQLRAGYYEISPENNIFEVIDIIRKGRVATFKVSIPEGSTLKEIISRFEEKTLYSKEDYLNIAQNIDFNKEYLSNNSDAIKYKLEGFLYPDTYKIQKNYKPTQIYKLMVNEFENRWFLRLKNKTANSNYSILELVTIASIVEKEAKLKEEKPIIAGIIYNRLEKNMKLQIDATIQYALPKRKERLLYSDLKIESKYNTYLYQGLPPGPISNPGDASLNAVLNPQKTEYLFYFAREDGSHEFSKTYQEHLEKQNELN